VLPCDPHAQDPGPDPEAQRWIQRHRLPVDARLHRPVGAHLELRRRPLAPGTLGEAARPVCAGRRCDRDAELPVIDPWAGSRSDGPAEPVAVVRDQNRGSGVVLVAPGTAPDEIVAGPVRAQHVRDRVEQGPEFRLSIAGPLDGLRVEPERHVVDEDLSIHLSKVDPPLPAVDERIQGADDIVSVHPKVEREVVPCAGRDARVWQLELGCDCGDDRLRPVASGHRQRIGAIRHGRARELLEIRTACQLDRVDAPGSGLAGEREPLRLPPSRLRVEEKNRPLRPGGRRQGCLPPERRPRSTEGEEKPHADQDRFRNVVAVREQDHKQRRKGPNGQSEADSADGAPPQQAIPAGRQRDDHATEHDQTAGELLDHDVEGQEQRRGTENESDGGREPPLTHGSRCSPGYFLPMRSWLAGLADNDALVARLIRIAVWVVGVAALILVLDLLGIPVSDWIRDLFKKIREVPAWAVLAGILLQSAQTTFAAVAWLTILRAAFPRAKVTFRLVLASYAVSVAMNGFLPANIGTLVMLIMFTTVIAGATFAAIFSGYLVQKIPFSVFNIAVYLYLFFSVAGSFSIKLSGLANHKILTVAIVVAFIFLLFLTTRAFRRQWAKLREQVVVGGAILGSGRRTLTGLVLPELGSYLARLGVIAVFLGAYSIPVTFHNVVSVTASNSVSNTVSVTPGGVGVTQALNSAALKKETNASNATAYSASQQLITSAWNVVFAVALVSWAFGWSGGKELVEGSYDQAKAKSEGLKKRRRARGSAPQAGG
jgi:uncharacterized membrane protein YbhN (UPF0104 family)